MCSLRGAYLEKQLTLTPSQRCGISRPKKPKR